MDLLKKSAERDSLEATTTTLLRNYGTAQKPETIMSGDEFSSQERALAVDLAHHNI